MNYFFHPIPAAIFFSLSIPISIIDIKIKRIPDPLNYSVFFTTLILQGICNPSRLANCLIAAAAAFLGFLAVRKATGGLGFGDVKYAASIGALCGLPLCLTAFLFASLTGLIAGVISLLGSGASSGDHKIPFAPFLCLGSLAAFLFERLELFNNFSY